MTTLENRSGRSTHPRQPEQTAPMVTGHHYNYNEPTGRFGGSPIGIVSDPKRFARKRKRPWVLVSFCNQLANSPLLGLVDGERMAFQPLKLPDDITATHNAATGIAVGSDNVFVSLVGPYFTSLLVLDRASLDIRSWQKLAGASATHSIAVVENDLFVASTGTDEVLKYRLSDDLVLDPMPFWVPDDGGDRQDRHHLNGLWPLDDGFIISGLDARGRMTDPDERLHSSGFVRAVPNGDAMLDGIWDPHSVTLFDDRLAFCESGTSSLRLVGRGVIRGFPGYTRGLCKIGDHAFVATSVSRHTAGALPFALANACTVSRVRLDDMVVERTMELPPIAREIYDLAPIPA